MLCTRNPRGVGLRRVLARPRRIYPDNHADEFGLHLTAKGSHCEFILGRIFPGGNLEMWVGWQEAQLQDIIHNQDEGWWEPRLGSRREDGKEQRHRNSAAGESAGSDDGSDVSSEQRGSCWRRLLHFYLVWSKRILVRIQEVQLSSSSPREKPPRILSWVEELWNGSHPTRSSLFLEFPWGGQFASHLQISF